MVKKKKEEDEEEEEIKMTEQNLKLSEIWAEISDSG